MKVTPKPTTVDVRPGCRLPWFVLISPEYCDDECDTGYGWEGWATDEDDAIAQALQDCFDANDRDVEDHAYDVDPFNAKLHTAEIDFRRFAGPLVHWARTTGNADAPMWRALEYAVAESKLIVAPFELIAQL